jgi:hypothetical protein
MISFSDGRRPESRIVRPACPRFTSAASDGA